MKSRLPFAVILVFFSTLVNAQTDVLPGHIVLSNGDTVKGEVGYKEWVYNPETIEFRAEEKGRVYNISELKAFSVDGKDTYRRFKVSYYLSASDLSEAKKEFGDKKETKDVWLRLIYQGETDLYELNTKQRIYFFIKDDAGSVTELVYRVRLFNNNLYKDESYKTVLSQFAKDNKGATELLQRIEYQKKDLLSFFKSLQQQQAIVLDKPKRRVKRDITLSLFALPLLRDLYNYNYDNTIGGSVGSGFTFSSARAFGKYQFRIGGNINYMVFKYKYGENASFERDVNVGCISLEPVFKGSYVINPLEKIQSAIGIETGYNFQIGKNWRESILSEDVGFARVSLGYYIAGSFGQIGISSSMFTYIGVFRGKRPPMSIGISYGYLF